MRWLCQLSGFFHQSLITELIKGDRGLFSPIKGSVFMLGRTYSARIVVWHLEVSLSALFTQSSEADVTGAFTGFL